MSILAIFASGQGTNAERLHEYLSQEGRHRVGLVVVDNPTAGVIPRAARAGIPIYLVRRAHLESGEFLDTLRAHRADLIVLAGFLGLIPEPLIEAYPGRIINLHPALLPKFGGKGMYGERVHRAVLEAGETESGITIHHVNARYDQGAIIHQARCPVLADDTVETLAARIHRLEYEHLPKVVHNLLDRL